ncbi:tobamovirus multiplication protein 1-like isoform x1 [Anaeramoeba flamelloides]|uniref:Tobamovirus multiplication protein 1-like isoform x1 n=1 Tax=Anaeramoeba flamelloides TaxID=1746091 RepID=A0ABQ8YT87_9EUKA|nr:tobamovirus multiplication protein 1-like isoform x1 [Anaeramoeba flamelloides]
MGSTSLIVLTILLSLLYATLGGYSLYRLFILRSRIKSWIYQQLFFGFMIIFSICRVTNFMIQLFFRAGPLIQNTYFKILLTFSGDFFISAFLLLIFAEAETYYQNIQRFHKIRIGKLLTASLVIFFIFEIPPKQGKLELVPVESVNEETPILNN